MAVVICAWCGGRGKGVTLKWTGAWYACNDGKQCAQRAAQLTPKQADWLARERLKISQEPNV